MSNTPAAQLARLKVNYPTWRIERAGEGFRATGAADVKLSADSLADLEAKLRSATHGED
jgi:hypothetical protein